MVNKVSKRIKIFSVILIIILCITFCIMSLGPSNDTFYLIKLGEGISKNGVDMIDHFSWIPNLPYTYPHWLYSLLIYYVYKTFGYVGIYISSIVCFITIELLIYYVNLKTNKDDILALIVSIICVVPLSYFMLPRSQSISIIFLFLELYFINKLIDDGKNIYSNLLIICSLIIANVHATIWIAFFVFFMPFFGEHIFYLFSKKINKKFTFNGRITINKIKNIRKLLITFIMCFVVGLLSPSRICYTYFIKIFLGNSQGIIAEHFPPILIDYPLIIGLLLILFFTKSKLKLSEFLMIFGLSLMFFIARRHLIFYFTIGMLYYSIIIKRNMNENKYTLNWLRNLFFKNWLIPFIILVFPVLICIYSVKDNIKNGFVSEKDYPIKAVQYIKQNLNYQNIKIMNHYDFGSYLLFNDIKVFIDSRCDLYNSEFNGMNLDIFDDFFDIYSNKSKYDYDKIVNKYGANYLLLYSNDIVHYLLKNDSRYKNIYSDDNFVLYQRLISE